VEIQLIDKFHAEKERKKFLILHTASVKVCFIYSKSDFGIESTRN